MATSKCSLSGAITMHGQPEIVTCMWMVISCRWLPTDSQRSCDGRGEECWMGRPWFWPRVTEYGALNALSSGFVNAEWIQEDDTVPEATFIGAGGSSWRWSTGSHETTKCQIESFTAYESQSPKPNSRWATLSNSGSTQSHRASRAKEAGLFYSY